MKSLFSDDMFLVRNPGAVTQMKFMGERHAYLSMCISRHCGAHSQRCAEHADVRIKILFRFTDNRDLILCWPLIFFFHLFTAI